MAPASTVGRAGSAQRPRRSWRVRTNREIVADAFAAWSRGEGYVASIFADEMTWEIVGRSRAAGHYDSARQFTDEVLHPFGTRFPPDAPFRPVTVRGIY